MMYGAIGCLSGGAFFTFTCEEKENTKKLCKYTGTLDITAIRFFSALVMIFWPACIFLFLGRRYAQKQIQAADARALHAAEIEKEVQEALDAYKGEMMNENPLDAEWSRKLRSSTFNNDIQLPSK